MYTSYGLLVRVNAVELAEIMKSGKEARKDFVVVDVRDDDFTGGNIKGAINEPSSEFLMNVDGLVKQTKDVPLVIFHCALSQVRGPKAARVCHPSFVEECQLKYQQTYAETRKNILEGQDINHEVAILRDGFSQFQVKFKDDPQLVENWDKDMWASEWS
ncbi:unnamed protein product [Cyclocybe aegerita]|uniref:Rhodanese domain-containing protein n=1 Tax=Cyclocybe aegerita TaxID=1973307 RepID=A0A8S0VRB7_CYCAE|nr:unnamed protein product [Cyclocybe aegerita]